tara:strand:+ start:835 stop:1035 length:201 start_codon:yes stop_codon:yes gene_type:complete
MSDEYETMQSPGRTAFAPANVRVTKKKSALSKPSLGIKKMVPRVKPKDPRTSKGGKIVKAKVGCTM